MKASFWMHRLWKFAADRRSKISSSAKRYPRIDGRGSIPGIDSDFSLRDNAQNWSGAVNPLIQWQPWNLSNGAKQSERETGPSSTSAEVKNAYIAFGLC
jgi:hypothetical protein